MASKPSPFFLTVDSPIDQAPSIDAVAAARLRGVSVTHITHLMQQDANRLADSLGLADVDARAIRRWQSECRLVCRVPHLRGFDARVLVGCGIRTPSELSSIHPVELLQRVEEFLATDRGQQLLLSGSSHELSRLTSWIAAANTQQGDAFDSDRYEYDSDGNLVKRRRSSRSSHGFSTSSSSRSGSRSGGRTSRDSGDRKRYGIRTVDRDGYRRNSNGEERDYDYVDEGEKSSREGESASTRRRRASSTRSSSTRSSSTRSSSTSRGRSSSSQGSRSRSERGEGRSRRSSHSSSSRSERAARGERETRSYEERTRARSSESSSSEQELRFYLQRESPVVDAPSIGARMAERLEAIGIITVDDLLTSDAATIAEQLDHRRIDAETVLEWQQQATLVCRVPMLRGHDAQLLVAAEITTAEELAIQSASDLFGIIDPIARSSEGKRIVRGGKLPDLEEVTDWISYAQHHRELRAA